MAYSINSKDYFKSKIYTGTGAAQTISGIGHEPSMIWMKSRTNAGNHQVTDLVRGLTKYIRPNATNTEDTKTNAVTAVNSDGFVLGADSSNDINANGQNYASWNWKANGAGSADSSGTASNVTVSANTTAGFSIVTATMQNVKTVPHGLGAVPDVIIGKGRDYATAWKVGAGDILGGWNQTLAIQSDGGLGNDDRFFYPSSVAPTATLFSSDQSAWGLGGSATETMVYYCFKQITGFSKFGKYSGNSSGSDGAFIYTGFKPSLIIGKYIGANYDWWMLDTARNPSNVANLKLYPNTTSVDATGVVLDMYSNGFKMYDGNQQFGQNGSEYFFMAFAESPLVGTNDIPANAK